MLSLATLDEVQRHNRDDEADGGSPCAKRTLCSRKRRDEDVLEHSKQLMADPIEPTGRTRSSLEPTFACPTPVYQNASRKNKTKTTNSIRLTIIIKVHVSTDIPSSRRIVDRKSTFSILQIRLHKSWPGGENALLLLARIKTARFFSHDIPLEGILIHSFSRFGRRLKTHFVHWVSGI